MDVHSAASRLAATILVARKLPSTRPLLRSRLTIGYRPQIESLEERQVLTGFDLAAWLQQVAAGLPDPSGQAVEYSVPMPAEGSQEFVSLHDALAWVPPDCLNSFMVEVSTRFTNPPELPPIVAGAMTAVNGPWNVDAAIAWMQLNPGSIADVKATMIERVVAEYSNEPFSIIIGGPDGVPPPGAPAEGALVIYLPNGTLPDGTPPPDDLGPDGVERIFFFRLINRVVNGLFAQFPGQPPLHVGAIGGQQRGPMFEPGERGIFVTGPMMPAMLTFCMGGAAGGMTNIVWSTCGNYVASKLGWFWERIGNDHIDGEARSADGAIAGYFSNSMGNVSRFAKCNVANMASAPRSNELQPPVEKPRTGETADKAESATNAAISRSRGRIGDGDVVDEALVGFQDYTADFLLGDAIDVEPRLNVESLTSSLEVPIEAADFEWNSHWALAVGLLTAESVRRFHYRRRSRDDGRSSTDWLSSFTGIRRRFDSTPSATLFNNESTQGGSGFESESSSQRDAWIRFDVDANTAIITTS